MSKFSLSHLIKSRGTRREYKESRGMIYNAALGRVGRKMSRTSKLRCCSEVNNGHLRDVFTTARRTIINDFFQTAKEPCSLYSPIREQ